MRAKLLVLTFLILVVPIASAQKLSQLEKEYGVNEVTIRRQAEADWVKDNKYIIYDWFQRKNHYVRLVSDDKLIHMLRNEETRERVGLDEANLTPYINEVKKERGLLYEKEKQDVSETNPKGPTPGIDEDEERFTDEGPVTRKISDRKKIHCVRSNALTIFDPFRHRNRWVRWVSDDWLLKIIETESSIVPRQCR